MKYQYAQTMKIFLTHILILAVMSFIFGATIVWWQIFHDSSFWLSPNRFIWIIEHHLLTLFKTLTFSRGYFIHNILETKERTGKPEIKTQFIPPVWPIFNFTMLCMTGKTASNTVFQMKVEHWFVFAQNKSLRCIKKSFT